MIYNIEMPSVQAGLSQRQTPYWKPVEFYIGQNRINGHIGIRKGATRDAWLFRVPQTDPMKKAPYQVQALGNSCGSYEQAMSTMKEYFDPDIEAARDVITVGQALNEYCNYMDTSRQENPAAAKDYRKRIKCSILSTTLVKRDINKLTTAQLIDWYNNELRSSTRGAGGCKRYITDLHAALNRCADIYKLSNTEWKSDAWRTTYNVYEPKKIEDFLPLHERQTLVNTLEEIGQPELANFCRALMFTACRPTEMYQAEVGDLDKKNRLLNLHTRKGGGKRRDRMIPLSKAAFKFFEEMVGNRRKYEPLIQDEAGNCFDGNSATLRYVRKLSSDLPNDLRCTSLRHTAITEWLENGMDVVTVAETAGTSVQMIQDNYHTKRDDYTRSIMESVQVL